MKPYFDPAVMLSSLVPPNVDHVRRFERKEADFFHIKMPVEFNELQEKSCHNKLRNSNEGRNVKRIREKFIDLFGCDSDCDSLLA